MVYEYVRLRRDRLKTASALFFWLFVSEHNVGMSGDKRTDRADIRRRAVSACRPDTWVLVAVQCVGMAIGVAAAFVLFGGPAGVGDSPVAIQSTPTVKTPETSPVRIVTAPVSSRHAVAPGKADRLPASYHQNDDLAGSALQFTFELVERPSAATPNVTARKTEEPAPAAPRTVSTRPLARFYSALAAIEAGVRTKPLTILHLGDSHIASDSLSRGIRKRLQDQFGSAGRGMMVPAGAYKYALADGVSFKRSGAWRAYNSLRHKSGPYALSGVRMVSRARGSKLHLTAKDERFDWGEVTVATGPDQGVVRLLAGAETVEFNARARTRGSKVVRIDAKARALTVVAGGRGATTVLSWSIGRNRPGIRYVNLGIAGATASITRRWSENLVANDVAHLKPDLIVWGYGTNEGFNDGLDLASYETLVKSFIAQLRAQAPEAELLLIGPADSARLSRRARHLRNSGCRALTAAEAAQYARASRTLRRWHEPPNLAAVRGFLKRFAGQENAGYWDWAQAMGGTCSIDRWAKSRPKLAARDRVHLTQRGYDRSAALLTKHLMQGFSQSRLLAAKQP